MPSLFQAMTAGALALAGLCPAGAQQGDFATQKETTPCFIKGIKERVQCLTLDMPLDYSDPDGVTIPIHTAVIPASSSNVEPDPIWVFAGGPGQAAGEYGVLATSAFRHIRQTRDIVLVDQRGTGKSFPLACEIDPSAVMETLADWTDFVATCRATYEIDVRHFTMENVIRDMEEVRAVLGYDQLNLWGGSWGTRTVGLYLKRYPEHVRSIIVDGVAPPDVSLFETAPTSAERAKRLLADDCRASETCRERFPDFEAQLATLMAKAEAGELHFSGQDPLSGEPLEMDINFFAAVESIRSSMYSADATVMIPYVVEEAVDGNLGPLLAAFAGGAASADSMYTGATLSILCGEEAPRTRARELQQAAADSFAKDSYYRYWAAGCEAWDAFPQAADAHDTITSDIPALILSGDLDPVTPPSMGDHWLQGFANGRHVVVAGNGHISSAIGCMPRLLGQFVENLDAQALDDTCLGHLKRLPVVTGLNGTVK